MSKILNVLLLCLCHMINSFNGEWFKNEGLWYYISPPELSVNYQTAVDMCDTLNARLAVITSWDQNEFLKGIINDGTYLWIGLSSNKTMLYNTNKYEYCKYEVLVWNNDWYCDITYSNLQNDNYLSKHTDCSGVAFSNGKWIAKDCSEPHGFICQWECKRIYMHFESTENSGVYTFGRYYNNNFVYYKEGDGNYRIYKSKSQKKWVVRRSDYYQYVHDADLYVPYSEEMSWTSAGAEKNISAGCFCVECDHLNICLYPRDDIEVCHDMYLMPHLSYPEYTNSDSTAVFMYYREHNCMGTDNIGNWCGYIFPYPRKITLYYIVDNNDTLVFTNLCVPDHIEIPTTPVQSSPVQATVSYLSQTSSAKQTTDASVAEYTTSIYETTSTPAQSVSHPPQASASKAKYTTSGQTSIVEYTTSTYETTNKPPLFLERKQNNKLITLSVSIAAVVITIIIVVAIVSIIFIRRRKRKRQYDEDPGGITTRHGNITNAQFNNNVYSGLQEGTPPDYDYLERQGSNLKSGVLEMQESNPMKNIKDLPDGDSNVGDYSYANFAIPDTRQDSTEIVETSTLEGKPPKAIHNEETQNKGYLAPDYGVLMDRNATQKEKGHANNTHEMNASYLEISNAKTKSISHSAYKSDSVYDLQLHENEVYDASADDKRPDNEQDNNVYYNDGLANAEHGINPQTKPKKLSNEGCIYQNAVSDSVDGGDDDLELFENSVYEHT